MREEYKILLRKLKEIGKFNRNYEYLKIHKIAISIIKKLEKYNIELNPFTYAVINAIYTAVDAIVSISLIPFSLKEL